MIIAGELNNHIAAGEPASQPDRAHCGFCAGIHEPHFLDARHGRHNQFGHLVLAGRGGAKAECSIDGGVDSSDNLRMLVPQDHRPPGPDIIDVAVPIDIEQIRLPDGRFANLNAQVVEVSRRTNTGVGDVDPEGGVRGGDKTKDDVTKVGAGAGIGAVIGAIAGGGRGAAIGAVIGAGVGTAGVLTSHGSDIRLEPGTELVLRTSTDTRIQ